MASPSSSFRAGDAPLESSSSSSSSGSSNSTPSPTMHPRDIKSDPADPLAFLLQSLGDAAGDTQDWSQLSAWTHTDGKFPDMANDFHFHLPMDLDFGPSMAVDPSALHFSSMIDQGAYAIPPPDNSYIMAADPTSNLYYPVTEEHKWPVEPQPQPGARRLSVISSSSSSGSSLSPVLDNASVASTSSPSSESGASDAAHELAQRVRQMAGVTLAVPVSAQVQQLAAAGGQSKLPIPRLARPTASPTASKQGSPNLDGSDKAESPASDATAPPATAATGRPKTSHTTIERRYRTNLNARITGLKHAVPALRVLEKDADGQCPFDDIVDARGFVDSVKVARKMSKANILGKATEYIRVLKKREARLKREQDGLKSLVSGLVGGPALLKEWEREWRERFGGEEKDEIEGDDAEGDAGSGDEDGDGEDSDGEDGDEGRARKKAKVAKPVKSKPVKPTPPPPVPTLPGAVPEKRKRGRPRKNPLPPTAPAPVQAVVPPPIFPSDQSMHDVIMQSQVTQQAPAQQYLLAVFAFFSVFNSPLTSSNRGHANAPHAHHGSVLVPHSPARSDAPTPSMSGVAAYGWHDAIQAVHLLVSTLVLFYVVLPWIMGTFGGKDLLSKIKSFGGPAQASSPASEQPVETPKAHNRAALMDALSPVRRGSSDEAARLRAALGVSDGVIGLMQAVIKAFRVDRGIELNQLKQRAWVRLGELVAFNSEIGYTTRLQTFWCMSWHISTFSASTTDLSTLALIVRPVSHAKASELWERARQREVVRADERLALTSMSVDDAAAWLDKWRLWHLSERKGRCTACEKRTPLGILAAILIRERLRKHAAALFVRTVVRDSAPSAGSYSEDSAEDEYVYDADKDLLEEHERKETVAAGKSIGGRTAELANMLERIWDAGFCAQDDILPPRAAQVVHDDAGEDDDDCEDEQDLASTDEAEIRALLCATIVYRRIFPTSLPACAGVSVVLSPPPSPSQRNAALHIALRTALGSPAFELGGGRLGDEELGAALEDARDRVVDMLIDRERETRKTITC